MLTNKQKAKDLIFIAKKLMENTKNPQTTELRETTRLYLKEFNSIKEPFIYKEDDDIITFCNEINKWYDEVYTNLFDRVVYKAEGFDGRYITMTLKQMNQIKDDVNEAYDRKTSGIYTIRAEKLKEVKSDKNEMYEYYLKHYSGAENIIYTIRDMEGDELLNMCRIIDKDTLLVRNDEKITLQIIIKKPFAIPKNA